MKLPRNRSSGQHTLGLDIRLMWGDSQLAEYLFQHGPPTSFTVGSGAGVDFALGDAKFEGDQFQVVRGDGRRFTLRFTGEMSGELRRGVSEFDLSQLIESGIAPEEGDAYGVSLEFGDLACVDLGGVTLEVAFQELPKPILLRPLEAIDFTALNIFLVVFFLGAFFVITALNSKTEGAELGDELSSARARISKMIATPPDLNRNAILKIENRKNREQGGRDWSTAGATSKEDSRRRKTRPIPEGDPSNIEKAREKARRIFVAGGQAMSSLFESNGLGPKLTSAVGRMVGAKVNDPQGLDGLWLSGTGRGGGEGNTIGIGGIITPGIGGGNRKYASNAGILGGKKSVDISITVPEPTISGSLDKEIIREVIHRNRAQIRFCYESELTRHPKLAGKVVARFVISGNGTVSSSEVQQTSVDNAGLETCVAARVGAWIFPKPKGGGVVIVTYPFIFKQSGE